VTTADALGTGGGVLGGARREESALVRLMIFFVIVIVLVARASAAADAPLWWGAVEERIGRLRAAGEPVEPGRLDRDLAPEGRNAAPVLLDAADRLFPGGRETLWSGRLGDVLREFIPPLAPEQRAEVDRLLGEGAAALEELDRVDERWGFDWGPLPASPVAVRRTKHSVRARLRAACALLRLDGLVALEWKDAPRAGRRAGQLRRLAEGLARRPGAMSVEEARLADAYAAELTAALCPPGAADAATLGPRESVLRTITRLLDDSPIRRDLAWQVRVERLVVIDTLRAYADGNLRPRDVAGGDWAAAALEGMGLLRVQPQLVVDYHTRLVDTLEAAPSLDQAVLTPRWTTFHEAFAAQGFAAFRLAQNAAPWYGEVTNAVQDRLASRRLGAVVLAVRLYRDDHGGALPSSLDELVPAYLPAVPDDPTSDRPAKARYRPDGPDPIVWFAGDNGKDDGGAELRRGMTYDQRRATDRVARLSARAVLSAPSQP
jgi:hypothetical protein